MTQPTTSSNPPTPFVNTPQEIVATAASNGALGFDSNFPIDATNAKRFTDAGYTFAVRYVPRLVFDQVHDLSATELQLLTSAGIGVMPVQHVLSDSPPWWAPGADDGKRYGDVAAKTALGVGIPAGVTVWLDLEGIVPKTDPAIIVSYCTDWHARVESAGFQPGIYIGYGCGLGPTALYELPFERYWAGYNLNSDEYPANVGVCMRQHSAEGRYAPPPGVPFSIDVDVVTGDALGRFPMLAASYQPLPG